MTRSYSETALGLSFFQVAVLLVGLFVLACAPEGRFPVEPEAQDDPRQVADIAGYFPLDQLPSIEHLVSSAKVTGIQPPPEPRRVARAWLEPNPSEHPFTHENPFWQTFLVRMTSDIDSAYVLVNPRLDGLVRALEAAGGGEPPFRNFCPAEWNDSTQRPRRNNWNLHLSACEKGTTYLLLYGWKEGELDLYNIYPITVK